MKLRPNHPRRHRVESGWGRALLFVVIFGAFAAYTAMVFSAGLGYYKLILPALRSLTGADTPAVAVAALARAPGNYLRARLSPPDLERIEIDIKFKHLHRLHEKRDEALRRGVLIRTEDDYVPAVIRHNGKEVDVKLRLKGDLPEHWRTDKLSLRIHVSGEDHLFGMRRFSIQAPVTRGYHLEPLFHLHLRREGVLSPRYFFVNVTVNGKDIGLMAVEEHFSKELLESQQRRDGVILRFDETLFWEHVVLTTKPGPFARVETSFLRPYLSSRVAASESLTAQWKLAAGLLRGFMDGELPAGAVFDLELMARFMAVAEVWRAPHSLAWINRRFYLNPLTSRLEPIGFDANLHAQYEDPGLINLLDEFSKRLLADDEFRAVFVRTLRRISREMADGTVGSYLKEVEGEFLRAVHLETPTLAPLDITSFEEWATAKMAITVENFGHFRASLGDPEMKLPSPVVAHLQKGPGGPFLDVTNTLPVEITIESLRFRTGSNGEGPEVVTRVPDVLPLSLAPTPRIGSVTRLQIPFVPPPGGVDAIEGTVRVRGQRWLYSFEATAYPESLVANPLPEVELREVLAAHPFLIRSGGASQLEVRPGTWSVERTLILPSGVGLKLGPNTTLRFAVDAGIIARGPLRFSGTEREPVVLEGIANRPWAGVFVVESEDPSHWSHVEVRNTGGFHDPRSGLTGGVTFRLNRVSLENCRFSGNRAEDALNIIRSEFSLTDVDIVEARSDALDADFTTGTIVGGRIAGIGGDAVDLSGSTVEVSGVRFEDIHDKALSVGEASTVVVRDITVERAGTAVASKDGSRVDLSDSTIRGIVHVALMAYSKKPVYGGAELVTAGVSVLEAERSAIAQVGSRVTIDGAELAAEELDVDALYQRGTMRK